MSRLDAVQYISHGIAKVKEGNQNEHIDENIVDDKSSNQKIKNVLDEFCINLNMKAKKGEIDKLIGRKNEIDRTIQILCRRQKNNLYLLETRELARLR